MKRTRFKRGSVVFNKRSKTWHYLWLENGHRKSKLIGTLQQYPTKAAAWKAAELIRGKVTQSNSNVPTVKVISEQYQTERLPVRLNTARVYRSWLRNHIVPRWGERAISDIQPREFELWLTQIPLSSKSRSHIRHLMRILIDFAMWSGALEVARNPINLVRVKGATQRVRQPRSLKPEEFQKLEKELHEPFRIMSLVAVCFGLRVSEVLALQWRDIDWLNNTLAIERRIVQQKVDEVKTTGSRKKMNISVELLEVLKLWRQKTEFAAECDWLFASPVQLGRLPYCDSGYWRELQRAAKAAGIGALGTHAFRHTYRSWLDAVGTPIAVQQKLMRHSDIRTTMNIYGDVVTDEMSRAHSKVVALALRQAAK